MCRISKFTGPAPSGVVLVAVVVVLGLAMALFGLWARAAVQEHRWIESEALRLQAGRLAESGVGRAIARHAKVQDYRNEIWSIPAAELQSRNAAEVRIRIEPVGDELHVSATADFPAGTLHRARVTQQIEILNPASGDDS